MIVEGIVKEAKKYPVDFLFLFLGLSVIIFFFFRFSHLPGLQEKLLLVGAGFYSGWGMVHHWARGDLSFRVVLEYLLLGLVVVGGGWLVLSRL